MVRGCPGPRLEPGAFESMTWKDFVTRFKREFVLAIEVQQLA